MVSVKVIFSLIFNVVSSVGLIFINKALVFKMSAYPFGTLLTVWHFLFNFLGCIAISFFFKQELKRVDILRVIPICFAFCGYVVFNNLSLVFNSVSFYQVTKILCTPLIIAIEFHMFRKRETRDVLWSLIPTCVGIFSTVYTDSQINFTGSVWAILAVLSNSFYTIFGKSKQNELGLNPLQILAYQAPISTIMLLPAIPFFDDWGKILAYQYTPFSIFCILLSCVMAFCLNFSFFLFVAQTDALTTNVLGYLKTCLIFLFGFLLFDDKLTIQNCIGIGLTMFGLAMYSKAKLTIPVAANEPPKPDEENAL